MGNKTERWYRMKQIWILCTILVLVIMWALAIHYAAIVTWSNANQGFTFLVLTVAYLSATFGMMLAMHRSNALAREGLEQASRPYVVFYLDFGGTHPDVVDAVIRNNGKTAAYSVQITLSQQLMKLWDEPKPSGLTQHPIQFLPPGHREVDALAMTRAFDDNHPERVFRGKISYEDSLGRSYVEPIHLDYNYRKSIGKFRAPNVGTELKLLREDVEAYIRRQST